MTKQKIKEQLERRIDYLKQLRSEKLKEANRLDRAGNYEDADIYLCTANATLARISEIEMIIELLK